jgi:hypothetical protein
MFLPLAHFRQLRTAAEDGDRRLIKSHHRLPMRPVAVSVQRPPLKDAPGHDNSEQAEAPPIRGRAHQMV